MAKRKPKKKRAPHAHVIGASGSGKQRSLLETLQALHHTREPFGIIDLHEDRLPKSAKPKSKR